MNILFIYAHMDDETLLSYGTINKFLKNNNINVLTFCGKSRTMSNSKLDDRILVYKNNMSNINYFLLNYNDVTLTKDIVDKELTIYLNKLKPQLIITHSMFDNHVDHRIISQEVLMFSRLNSNSKYIKLLWTTALPTTVLTYNLYGTFLPNIFIDISKFIKKKENALLKYSNIYEIPYDDNDIRSVKSCLNYNKQYGYQINSLYAEAYQLLFLVI